MQQPHSMKTRRRTGWHAACIYFHPLVGSRLVATAGGMLQMNALCSNMFRRVAVATGRDPTSGWMRCRFTRIKCTELSA